MRIENRHSKLTAYLILSCAVTAVALSGALHAHADEADTDEALVQDAATFVEEEYAGTVDMATLDAPPDGAAVAESFVDDDAIVESPLDDGDFAESFVDDDVAEFPMDDAVAESSVDDDVAEFPVDDDADVSDAGVAVPHLLDLISAQRRALADNPSIAAGLERIQQVRQLVAQVRSLYFPQVEMSYTYTFTWLPSNYTNSVNAYLDQSERMLRDWRKESIRQTTITRQPSLRDRRNMRSWYRSTQQLIDNARDNIEEPVENTTMSVMMGWLIFDGFARELANAMARYGYDEAQAAFRDGQRLLIDAVAQAYYGAQFAREQLAIGKSDVAFYERLHREAVARREVGRGATSHVLSFETLLYAAQATILRAQRDYEMACIALAYLLGIPEQQVGEAFELAALEGETPETMMLPETDAMVSLALAYRPDLEQRELGLRRANAAVRREYAKFAPQIAAIGQLQTANVNDTGFETDRITTTVGINASMSLFTGGRRRAEVLEAKHARREAEWRIVEAEQKVISEVRQAITDLKMAQEALTLQRNAASSVEKNRDLMELEYNAGKAMLVSLSQAQRDYMQAMGMLAQARVNLQRTWQALHIATGVSLAIAKDEMTAWLYEQEAVESDECE